MMKSNIILCIILFILGELPSSLNQSTSQNKIINVYRSTIYKQFDASASNLYYKDLQLASDQGLIFFRLSSRILQIIDESNSLNQLCEYQFDQNVIGDLQVTSDGSIIIVNMQNGLTFLKYEKTFNKVTKFYLYQSQQQITLFNLNKKQTKVYVIRQSQYLEIVSLSDLTVRSGQLDKAQTINDFVISDDDAWICISSDAYGIKFFQVTEVSDSVIDLNFVSENRDVNPNSMIVIKNQSILITQDYWQGLSVFNITSLVLQIQQGQNNIPLTPTVLNWWIGPNEYPYSNALEISADETQLFVGARTTGIIVVDIQNINSLNVFQVIEIDQDIISIAVSPKTSYLYLQTQKTICIFIKDQANLQEDQPNLYNKHLTTLQTITDTPYSWRSQILQDSQYLLVTCSQNGLYIIQININSIYQPLKVVSKIQYQFTSFVDNFLLFRSERYLLIPVQDPSGYIFDIYDISCKLLPKRVQRIPSAIVSYVYSMSSNQDETLFAFQNLKIIYLYEISLSFLFTQVSNFEIPSYIDQQSNSMLVLNGFPYILLLFRGQLIISLDISDIKTIKISDERQSLGAEYAIQGLYLNNYCFIADGLEGVSIIDLQQLPKLVVISQGVVQGYSNYLNLIQSDRYIISNQLTGGQLSLIDLTNIQQPQSVSSLQLENEVSVASSVLSDLQNIFVLNGGGIRIFKININLLIHYEYSLIKTLNTGLVQSILLDSFNPILSVGQKIGISLNPLFPQQGQVIENAYFVDNTRFKSLPSWITFESEQKLLIVNVIKDSIQVTSTQISTNYTQITSQTIVFQTKFVINQDSFIYQSEVTGQPLITSDMSSQIIMALRERGILNHLNQISDQFAQDGNFSISSIQNLNLSEEAIMKIESVLQSSLLYSPITLKMQSSLVINFLINSQAIKSNSIQASITFKIDSTKGKFVYNLYPGVVTSTSASQDKLNLVGEIVNLNLIFLQKIKIYFFNQEEGLLSSIEVVVDDGMNNIYDQSFQFKDIANLFDIRKNISIFPYEGLQSQVNREYSNGVIDIDSLSEIQFSFNTYEYAQFNELTLQAYQIIETNNLSAINQSSDISFSPSQFKISIKTTTSDYKNNYCFSINATDSYSWVEDSFCVNASGISLQIILNILLSVGGPLILFFGIFKYWNKLFNLTLYKKNKCGEKYICKDSLFVQKIIVVNNSFEISSQLFNSFVQSMQKTNIKNENKTFRVLLTNQISSPKLLSPQSEYRIDRQTDFPKKQYIMEPIQIKKLSSLIKNAAGRLRQKLKAPQSKYIFLEKYITPNQLIDHQKFVVDLYNANIPIIFKGKKLLPKEMTHDLNDSGSVIYNCLNGILCKKILLVNQKTNIVYQYIKQCCTKISDINNRNQWTSILSQANHELQQKKYNEEQIIPKVQLNMKLLQQIILLLAQKLSFIQKATSPFGSDFQKICEYLEIDSNLIIQNIIADTIGITSPTGSKLFPNSGECIHLDEHKIKKIEINKKQKYSKGCLSRNPGFVPLFLRKNQSLPSWLKLKIDPHLITIYGTPPENSELNELKLSIFNNSNCIIREIIFKFFTSKQQSELTFTDISSIDEFQAVPLEQENKNISRYAIKAKGQKQERINNESKEYAIELQQNSTIQSPYRLKQKIIFSSSNLSDFDYVQDSNILELNRKIEKTQNPLVGAISVSDYD